MALSKRIKPQSHFEIDRCEINSLISWYKNNGRKPLLLRGARQVGKTSLVRMFCKMQKLHLIEINLELHQDLAKSFKQMDPTLVVKDIELFFKTKLTRKSVLFIDEIQTLPEAIQGLRYFYEKLPHVPVIAAGSLLEFVLSDHRFSMPVGRIDLFYIGPLKFSDFVKAKGNLSLYKTLQSYKIGDEITTLQHETFLEIYLEFLLVGGMPEAVREYLKSSDLKIVKKIQKSILDTYRADFGKYARRIPIERIDRIFRFAGTNVARKVKYSEINPDEQSKNLLLAIELLEKAGIVYRVFHSSASGIPLLLNKNEKIFKFLFMDVGLVSGFIGIDLVEIRKIYFDPPSDLILLHKGMISEQFVGQSLLFNEINEKGEIFYWLRDESTQKAEVDFVIEKGFNIIPIEVKAGKTGSIRSLIQFAKEKKSKYLVKFGTQKPTIRSVELEGRKVKVFEFPLYLSERLRMMSLS